jgi:hypothetical protein
VDKIIKYFQPNSPIKKKKKFLNRSNFLFVSQSKSSGLQPGLLHCGATIRLEKISGEAKNVHFKIIVT